MRKTFFLVLFTVILPTLSMADSTILDSAGQVEAFFTQVPSAQKDVFPLLIAYGTISKIEITKQEQQTGYVNINNCHYEYRVMIEPTIGSEITRDLKADEQRSIHKGPCPQFK